MINLWIAWASQDKLGKHDFKKSPEQEIAELKRRVAELEDLTMGMRSLIPVRLGPSEKTEEEIAEAVHKAVERLRGKCNEAEGQQP